MTSRRLFLTLTLVTSLYAALPSQPPNISSQELVVCLDRWDGPLDLFARDMLFLTSK